MESNRLKIIEWNVKSIQEKRNKVFNELIDIIVDQKADIVVLTEVTGAQRAILSRLLESPNCNYSFAATSNQTPNGVDIIVSADKINKVMFCDNRTYKNQSRKKDENKDTKENASKDVESKVYPDILLMTAYLKSGKKICLMGTRFSTSNLSINDKKMQINCFYEIVKKYRPRLVIGDFNWESVIAPYIESTRNGITQDKEKAFCSKIRFNGTTKEQTKVARFKLYPQDGYSFKTKKGIKKYTNPDRVIFDTNTFEEISIRYYPDNLENEGFPQGWPSDHAMLICEISIKE